MDLMKMMKQAQEIQGRMQKMQEDLVGLEVEGQSGAGLVKVTLNGKLDARGLKIDPSLIKPEDAEMLEDLIVAAFQDAKTKAEAAVQSKMQEITGGLSPPARPQAAVLTRGSRTSSNSNTRSKFDLQAGRDGSPPPCGEGSGVGGASEDAARDSSFYVRVFAIPRFPFIAASSPHP